MNDFHFAVRSLAKSPGFSVATVVTLALGIGSAAAIFSAADRVLFRALPYPSPEQLVLIGSKTKQFDFLQSHYPIQFAAYREHAKSFSAFAAVQRLSVNFVVGSDPLGVSLGRVSLDFFPTLGEVPMIGRAFLPGEDQPGADNVVVLTHRLWQERFGGDPGVLGRDVSVGGQLCRVVGVLPKTYSPPPMGAAELYQPLVVVIDPARPFTNFLYVIARLHAGVTAAAAQAEVAGIQLPVAANASSIFREMEPRVVPLIDVMRPRTTQAHWALLAAVGFLYAIACANAGNLMFARLHGRRKELSVRLAIGCGRGQLARLVGVENLVLTLLAGAAGVLVAAWIFPALLRMVPAAVAIGVRSHVDWRALAFTIGLSVITGLLLSLAPAWHIARANVTEGLKEGAQTLGESPRLRRTRGALVMGEAALAVALLVGAGLMVRTVQRLNHINRGFDPANKVAVWLQLPGNFANNPYSSADARRQFHARLEEQLRAIPGVEGVAMASVVPLAGTSLMMLTKPDGTRYDIGANPVSPGYLRMLGLPLLKGRWFDDSMMGRESVIVINETMARGYFGQDDPIGRPFAYSRSTPPWQVIGIVADVREQVREKPRPQVYFPYWQRPSSNVTSVLLRLAKPVDVALADAVRRAVYAIDPLVATMPLRPLAEAAAAQIASERYALAVLQVLSALALGLAVAGLFAVMAYAVAQRMGEFGVRLAFGAMPAQLFRLVLLRGVALAGAGIVIGTGLAWTLTRFMQSLLYETSAHDPLTYALVALILLGAAVLGCWIPARRAMRVDVATLLRAE